MVNKKAKAKEKAKEKVKEKAKEKAINRNEKLQDKQVAANIKMLQKKKN